MGCVTCGDPSSRLSGGSFDDQPLEYLFFSFYLGVYV